MKSRAVLLAILLVVLVAGLLAPHEWRNELLTRIQAVIDTLRGLGVAGVLATAGLQGLVAASGVIPASFLGMAAGAAYGFILGFLIAASGTMVGAVAAFWLSRSIFRPYIAQLLMKKASWKNFDAAIARDGWRFVCLIRLSPIMPFAITSYSLGLSSISFKDYLIGTTASLPALGLYIFLGTLAHVGMETLTSTDNPWLLGLLLVGAAATILLSVRVGQLAMRASSTRLGGESAVPADRVSS
jgi:uncharacterized membrane protein YdjX (TVP38/TMEM64 family)